MLLKPKINDYIQKTQKFEDFKDTFLEQKKDVYLPDRLIEVFMSTSKERLVKKFISTTVTRLLQSSISLKNVKNIEPVLELEINRASLKLKQLRDDFESVDISEGIWNYSKSFIRDISEKFWIKFGKHLPKPKFEFIDESIEIRWVRSNSKLILSITDYFDDIIIYFKTGKGQYISIPVPRREIEDWVFLWLNQIWKS